MSKLEELYKILRADGLDIDAIELAESLWLSQYISKKEVNVSINEDITTEIDTELIKENTEFINTGKTQKDAFEKSKIKGEKRSEASLFPASNGNNDSSLPFRAPLVSKLYKDNNLLYALRHFKQKVISRKQLELNEEKIAEYITRTGFFRPFYKKNYEKRFNVVFIVDISESMSIWDDLINNFIKDVRKYHIFKKVSDYYILTDSKTPEFFKRKDKKSRLNEKWYKHTDPNTLIFMFSDMVSKSWSSGRLLSEIDLWQRHSSFSIIQMLPQRLWSNTKLIDASIGKMSNPKKFSLNNNIKSRAEDILSVEESFLPQLVKIPILNFDENSMDAYGRVINSLSNNRIDGALFEKEDFIGEYKSLIDNNSEIKSENKLKSFYKYASMLSKQLLELLAVIPLTLPIIKLIQQSFLPESTQAHLSEVLISNVILKENTRDGFYRFYKSEEEEFGVREILINKIGAKKAFETVVKLSTIIHQQGGTFDFLAYIIDPNSLKKEKEFNEIDREFAKVSISILKEMGAKYKEFADNLEDTYSNSYNSKSTKEESTLELDYNPLNSVRLVVIGVGGAGCNMINHMINEGLEKVDLIAVNTDLETLNISKASRKIQLGKNLTKGLGASMKPDIGRDAALESYMEIKNALKNADIVFIAAGLGGGTGTGAAPIISKIAKEVGAMPISVITKPFTWEGKKRTNIANIGLDELKKVSDSIIVISNDKLLEVIDDKIGMKESFKTIDDFLLSAVNGVAEIVFNPNKSNISVDLNDIKVIMQHKGNSLIGIGKAKGEKSAHKALHDAIASPLLEDVQLDEAKGILIHFTVHSQAALSIINEVVSLINERVESRTEIIFGTTLNDTFEIDEIKIVLIATGIEEEFRKKNLNESLSTWKDIFDVEAKQTYFNELQDFLKNEEKKGKTILPPKNNWFKAFDCVEFSSIKVVILGEDPYHRINRADGLAYSVLSNSKIPPSIRNIFKELKDDLNIDNVSGNLQFWAEQGVLLLNRILTVEENKPKSHHNIGWEIFTTNILDIINKEHENIVFILWGNSAIKFSKKIDKSKHFIITGVNPSPLSAHRGFFGSKPFSKTNKYLQKHNIEPINWALPKIEKSNIKNDETVISDVTFNCKKCNTSYSLGCEELDWNQVNGSERGMGAEIEHEAEYYETCHNCSNEMSITFNSWEYPIGTVSHNDVSIHGIINLEGTCSFSPEEENPHYQIEERDNAIEEMKDWFFENYDDPANFLPYNGREGGYQYLFGGPYELNNVLYDQFGYEYSDDYIQSVIEIIENEFGNMSWGKKFDEDDYVESSKIYNGLEKINESNVPLIDKGLSNTINAQVDGDFNGWNANTIIKLTNGEIWKQTEYFYSYIYSYMPHVTITNSFNVSKMKVEGIDKEVIVEKLSNVIESKIKGDFSGWNGDTVIELINGQKWKQSTYSYNYSYGYNLDVLIYQSDFGFKIKVDGNNEIVDIERVL